MALEYNGSEHKIFLDKYLNASFGNWTQQNLGILNPFLRDLGPVNAARLSISQYLNWSKKYHESIRYAQMIIEDVNVHNLDDNGLRVFSLAHFYLAENYEALGDTRNLKIICQEALKILPAGDNNREDFIDKLKALQ